jgi:4-amino-4-deoxy-L-arabinose transferase-like glycosyltransferase
MSLSTPDPMVRVGLWLPLALCASFLVVGLLTLDAYGATWDEPLHRDWGERVWAYMMGGDSALIRDLPGGGRYYGPLFYILSYGVSEFAYERLGMSFTAANHLLTLITATLGVLCTFLLAEMLSTRRAATVATLLLILLPPFMAHAHYNPKDIPLLVLSVAVLLFATHTYRTRLRRHALLTGMFLGIALSMKPTVIVLLPIVAAAVLADMFVRRAWGRAELRTMALLTVITALAAAVSLVLAWPTLWRDPYILVETIRYFGMGNFWSGDVLYRGEFTLAADLPWHYMPVMLLLSIPVVAFALAAIGAVALVLQASGPDPRRAHHETMGAVFSAVLLLAWVVLPLLMFMKPGLPRYDGIRQVMFMIPAIMILGGIGFDALWRRLPRSRSGRGTALAAVGIVAGWLVVEAVYWFPYGGSYVNAPARAVLGPHLERQFEIEYWGASYREGARWLQANAPAGSVVCVPVAGHVLDWQPDALRDDLVVECAGRADYVMLMTRRSQWHGEYDWLSDTEPVYTVSRVGSALMHLYRTP